MNNRGAASPRTLFWGLFLAVCLYAGYLLVPPYTTFYLFKTEVENEATLAHIYSDADLAKRIYERAMDWNIPINLRDIRIIRGKNEINITIFYVVTLDVAGYYQRDMEYFVDVTRLVVDSSGIMLH